MNDTKFLVNTLLLCALKYLPQQMLLNSFEHSYSLYSKMGQVSMLTVPLRNRAWWKSFPVVHIWYPSDISVASVMYVIANPCAFSILSFINSPTHQIPCHLGTCIWYIERYLNCCPCRRLRNNSQLCFPACNHWNLPSPTFKFLT